jgi:hypothetical protein
MSNVLKKLQECTCAQDSLPILNSIKAKPALRRVVETAIELQQSKDPRQQHFAHNFWVTAKQEMEDDEKIQEEKIDFKKGDVEKPKQEEQLVTARDSKGSTDSTAPYPGEGTDEPQSDIESMQTASGENQMQEGFPPPQGGGMPPQGGGQMGMPQGMCPEVGKQLMGGQAPQMPPMSTPQAMQQMHYTVREALRPVIAMLKKHNQAIEVISHQVQESTAKSRSMQLDIGSVKANALAHDVVRETENTIDGIPVPAPTRFDKFNLEETRRDIATQDNNLQKSGRLPYL